MVQRIEQGEVILVRLIVLWRHLYLIIAVQFQS